MSGINKCFQSVDGGADHVRVRPLKKRPWRRQDLSQAWNTSILLYKIDFLQKILNRCSTPFRLWKYKK